MNTEQPKQPEQPNSFHLAQVSGNAATAREVRHTPGPFVLSEPGKLEGRTGTYRQVIGDGGTFGADIIAHVCVAHPYNHDLQQFGEANARLFKAAPGLLAVAQMVLDEATDSTPPALIAYAQAAIAKATGSAS